jgi:transcriptional regulator with XRE-family HTH domain
MNTIAYVVPGAAIFAYRRAEGITQKALAQQARVSQSTVSRAERSLPIRDGEARNRLFTYMQRVRPTTDDAEPALTAVRETWDGTEAHAEALATLIRASLELWRGDRTR